MGRIMKLAFAFDEASVYDVREINSTFAVGSLKVMYTGENRNGSFMSRSAVEKALPSLYNVPIVCHWDYQANEIGSHDVELVTDGDGNMRLRNLTEPCGVVPESAKFRFAVETDESGAAHEYLIIDGVYLWKRQDVFRHIMLDLDGKVDHSMEIHVLDGDFDDSTGLYVIRSFEFTALCLLESAEPCFEGSELEVFSNNIFKQKMEQMMADLKETFSAVTPVNQDNDTPESDEKGGEVLEYSKDELLEKCGVSAADIDVDVESLTYEELEEELKKRGHILDEMLQEVGGEEEEVVHGEDEPAVTENEEVVEEPVEEDNEPLSEEKYALSQQLRDEIVEELSHITVESEFGEWPRYWLMDYDPDAEMIYCYDEMDWKLYGFSYSMDGDHVVIDFESRKRMKIAIVEFDEGEQGNPIADVFQAAAAKYASNEKGWAEKFQTASEQIDQANEELKTLRKFKEDMDEAAEKQEREKVFSEFTDLNGDEAFDALRENAGSFSVDELREKCYAIRGRRMAPANYARSGEQRTNKLPVSAGRNDANEPYNGLFVKYGFAKE